MTRRLYIWMNKVIHRHVPYDDCWCKPRVVHVPGRIRPTGRPS